MDLHHCCGSARRPLSCTGGGSGAAGRVFPPCSPALATRDFGGPSPSSGGAGGASRANRPPHRPSRRLRLGGCPQPGRRGRRSSLRCQRRRAAPRQPAAGRPRPASSAIAGVIVELQTAVQHACPSTRNPAPLAGRHCLQCAGGGPFSPTCVTVALADVVACAAADAVRSRLRWLPRSRRTVIVANVRPLALARPRAAHCQAAQPLAVWRLPSRSRWWPLCGAYREAPPLPPPQLSREATCDHYLSRVCRCPTLVSRGNGATPRTRPHLLIQTKRSLMRAAGGPRLMAR